MPNTSPFVPNHQRKGPILGYKALATLAISVGLFTTLAGFAADSSPAGASITLHTSSLPVSIDQWNNVIQFGSYGNTTLNDCSMAAIGDLEQVWNADLGGVGTALPDAPIVNEYLALTRGSGLGVYPAATFSAWEHGVDGKRIASVAPITLSDTSVKKTVMQLGGFYAVINISKDNVVETVPTTTHTTISPAWSLSANSKTSTGAFEPHAVAVVGYNAHFVYLATWGTIQPVTWSWWNSRVVQAWAILPQSFVTHDHGPVSSLATITRTFFSATELSAIPGPYAT